MKELSIEEKAKAYDEAIERAKKQLNEAKVFDYKDEQIAHDIRTTTYDIFPELKVSKDEKIRQELIIYLKAHIGETLDHTMRFPEWIAWIEKQGKKGTNGNEREIPNSEQKSAWSEEDEKFVHGLIRGLSAKRDIHGHTTFSSDGIDIAKTIDWLKSLKDRVQPQPKWSEEDKQYLLVCKNALYKYQSSDQWDAGIIIRWLENKLKSLRPQSHWMPSDEQMEALRKASKNEYLTAEQYDILVSLYDDLKKLREE